MTYGYDAANRLTALTYKQGGSVLGDLAYAYDPAGRRTAVAGSYARTGLPAALATASHDAGNRLTAWGGKTLSYDANGNLTGDGTTTYLWNNRNQLSQISQGGTTIASFTYDPFGRRTTKTVGTSTTSYLYDGVDLVQELNGSTPTANYLSGPGIDEVHSRTDSSGARHYLTDALGSTLALTDGSGVVKTSYTYEPYGATTTSGLASGNPVQYTGREYDGTGLYYYRARYYHPGMQRFISEDPIGLAGGLNLYGYANQNPLSFTDPLGLVSTEEALTQVGAVGPIDAYTASQLADKSLAAAAKSGLPGLHNGPADAYRHCLWSCQMAKAIGAKQATEVGNIHEKLGKNPPCETCMDLHNNAQGRSAAGGPDCSASCRGLLTGGQLQTSPGGTPPGNLY